MGEYHHDKNNFTIYYSCPPQDNPKLFNFAKNLCEEKICVGSSGNPEKIHHGYNDDGSFFISGNDPRVLHQKFIGMKNNLGIDLNIINFAANTHEVATSESPVVYHMGNRGNKVYLQCKPLPQALVSTIEETFCEKYSFKFPDKKKIYSDRLSLSDLKREADNFGISKTGNKKKLIEGLNKISEDHWNLSFAELKDDMERIEKFYDLLREHKLCEQRFHMSGIIFKYETNILIADFEDFHDIPRKEYDKITDCIYNSFREFCDRGGTRLRPIMNTCFVIKNIVLARDAVHRGGGTLHPVYRYAFKKAFAESNPMVGIPHFLIDGNLKSGEEITKIILGMPREGEVKDEKEILKDSRYAKHLITLSDA